MVERSRALDLDVSGFCQHVARGFDSRPAPPNRAVNTRRRRDGRCDAEVGGKTRPALKGRRFEPRWARRATTSGTVKEKTAVTREEKTRACTPGLRAVATPVRTWA